MRRLLLKSAAALAAHWRVGLLALVTTLVWCGYYDRWTPASWSIPTEYRGDALEVLARIGAAAEGDTQPLRPQEISRLNAPFGANWSAYPSSDLLLLIAIGQLAKLIGVFPAANVALLLATLTSALSFYGCARWLRARWEWAFAGALLFAFTFQTFHRGLPHLFFVFSWTVPLALLTCALVAGSRRLRRRGRLAWFCLGTAACIGVGNPYVLFLFLQLLGWAVIAQWLGARRRDNMITGLAALALAIAAFFVVESHVWLFTPDSAASSPLLRNYGSTERYALKPLELVLPPNGHRWDALAFFGHRYVRWSEWRSGEPFAPYLGLVGIAGLGWLAFAALSALLRRQRLPSAAMPAGWILAFCSVGGLTNIMAFFTGLLLFRATNRFSIFISAIVLMFVVGRMSRWWVNRSTAWSVVAALLVAAIGLADQLPQRPGVAKQQWIAEHVAADRALGEMLEGKLSPKAMVFQLPVMSFPESPPAHQLGDYEHFRLYLATHSVRFSYGMLRGRSRGRWQRDAEALPTSEFVRKLERYGFAALYFNRKAYPDGGEKLLRELDDMGRGQRDEHGGEHVVVFLKPDPRPVMPVAKSLTFGRGWQSAERGQPRWAYGPASFSYFNPHANPVPARVKLVLSGVGDRDLRIKVNGGEAIAAQVGAEPRDVVLPVMLKPGFNRVDIEATAPAVRVSHERGQLRSFAAHEATVTIEEPNT